MPVRVREPEYAHDFSTRRVSSNGQLRWKSITFKTARALGGMALGFRQVDERSWHVFFGPVHIANASVRDKVARIEPLR